MKRDFGICMNCSELQKSKGYANRYVCLQEYKERCMLRFTPYVVGDTKNKFKKLDIPKGCQCLVEYKMKEWNKDEKEA